MARGSSRRWRRTRAYVLARDGYRCRRPEPHDCRGPLDAGHIVAVIDGGSDDPSNLRAECAHGNRGEGARLGNPRRRLGTVDLTW